MTLIIILILSALIVYLFFTLMLFIFDSRAFLNSKFNSFPQIIAGKIKEKIRERTIEMQYPVPIILGTKNEVEFSKERIEKEFNQLSNLFEVYYFKGYMEVSQQYVTCYTFAVNGGKKDLEENEVESLAQTIAERVVQEYLILLGYSAVTPSDFVVVSFSEVDLELNVFVAQNPYGVLWIDEFKQRKKVDSMPTKEQVRYKRDENTLVWGYELGENPKKIPLRYSLTSHPHALITGSTGSGKTNTLLFLIREYISLNNGSLWLCDFKNGADFRFMKCSENYFVFDECYNGIKKFYSEFVQDRKKGIIQRRQLLIIDEYNSLIGYLSTRDKANKTKYAQEVQSMVGEILAMGRSLGYMIWISVQRPDSTIFATGSRDNFLITLALGNPSKEHFNMMFSGEDKPERIFKTGQGVLKADGYPMEIVQYPLINISGLEAQLKEYLFYQKL